MNIPTHHHWFKFLPEAGRPLERVAEQIEAKWERIANLKAQAKAEEQEALRIENEMIATIRSRELWTEQEIQAAKNDASNGKD